MLWVREKPDWMCTLWKCSPKMLGNVTGTGNTGKEQGRA